MSPLTRRHNWAMALSSGAALVKNRSSMAESFVNAIFRSDLEGERAHSRGAAVLAQEISYKPPRCCCPFLTPSYYPSYLPLVP
jgi:hypothetical protein